MLEFDNCGPVDLINNYIVGGFTCHMKSRNFN